MNEPMPFAGTYRRKIDRRGNRNYTVFPTELLEVLAYRGEPQHTLYAAMEDDGATREREPAWASQYLKERDPSIHLELADRVEENFDRHRFFQLGAKDITLSLPFDLAQKMNGDARTIDYYFSAARIKIAPHGMYTAPPDENRTLMRIQRRKDNSKFLFPEELERAISSYYRPAARLIKSRIKGHYILIKERLGNRPSRSDLRVQGRIINPLDLFSDMPESALVETVKTPKGHLEITPFTSSHSYCISRTMSNSYRLAIPPEIRLLMKPMYEQGFGFFKVCAKQPRKNTEGPRLIITDLPKQLQSAPTALHFDSHGRFLLPNKLVLGGSRPEDAIFISRGNTIEVRVV